MLEKSAWSGCKHAHVSVSLEGLRPFGFLALLLLSCARLPFADSKAQLVGCSGDLIRRGFRELWFLTSGVRLDLLGSSLN